MKIQTKLITAFISMTLVSLGTLGILVTNHATQTVEHEVSNALNTLADEKLKWIYQYIKDKEQTVISLAHLPVMTDALGEFTQAFQKNIDGNEYQQTDLKFRNHLSQLKEQLNTYDLILISPNGDIVFTVIRESDFGSNLNYGELKNTQLAAAYRQATTLLETRITKFEPYAPSQWQNEQTTIENENQSAFIAAPVFKDEQLVGAVAVQYSSNDYYHLAEDYTGLKQTGEIVIGKQDKKYALVIAPLRHYPQAAFNLRFPIGSRVGLPLQSSVQGEKGAGYSVDYDNNHIIAAWRYIPELEWGLVVKLDSEEALASANQLEQQLLILGVIITSLTIGIAIYISRRLTAPLQRLVDTTHRIASGDLSPHKETSSDEIGQLGKAINHMLTVRRSYEQQIAHESKIAQQALKELSIQKYALDQHALVTITDNKGIITFVNDKFIEVSGYSRTELLGQSHQMLTADDQDESVIQGMYQTLSRGQVWHDEICNKHKSGSRYWLDSTIVPYLDDDQHPKNYISIHTEITNKKNTELELLRSEAQLRGMLNSVVDAIIMINEEGIIQTINQSALAMFDYELDDILHQNITALMPSSSRLAHSAGMERYLSTGITKVIGATTEVTGLKRNGTEFPMEIFVSEIYIAKQRYFTASAHDLTQRKLNEAKLIEAKNAAQQAAKIKNDFLAKVSHDIRVPINGILAILRLLQNDQLTPEQQQYIQMVRASTESLYELLNDILDFSKIEAGKLELEFIEFDLLNVIGNLTKTLNPLAINKGLELILDTTGIHHPVVTGDPTRVRQLLKNLVRNAIKYTEAGEIIVRVALLEPKKEPQKEPKEKTRTTAPRNTMKPQPEQRIVLSGSVQDTGIGIPVMQQESLFQSLSEADTSLLRKTPGTRLGLSISKKLCHLMKGDLQVTSQLNKGSTFSFELQLQASQTSLTEPPPITLQGLDILIADTNTSHRKVLAIHLQQWGATTHETGDAESTLLTMQEHLKKNDSTNFNVIFIDEKITESDNGVLINIIQSNEAFTHARMILMTSSDNQIIPSDYANHQFDGRLSKPFTQREISSTLRTLLPQPATTLIDQAPLEQTPLEQPSSDQAFIEKSATAHQPLTAVDYDLGQPCWPESCRVLLVESSQINQAVTHSLIESMNLRCDIAGNGEEAITVLKAALNKAPYDLILMDCQMPEQEGFKTTESIRKGHAGEKHCKCPVIAMSSEAQASIQFDYNRSGMNDYLRKPIDPEELKALLIKWLIPSND